MQEEVETRGKRGGGRESGPRRRDEWEESNGCKRRGAEDGKRERY